MNDWKKRNDEYEKKLKEEYNKLSWKEKAAVHAGDAIGNVIGNAIGNAWNARKERKAKEKKDKEREKREIEKAQREAELEKIRTEKAEKARLEKIQVEIERIKGIVEKHSDEVQIKINTILDELSEVEIITRYSNIDGLFHDKVFEKLGGKNKYKTKLDLELEKNFVINELITKITDAKKYEYNLNKAKPSKPQKTIPYRNEPSKPLLDIRHSDWGIGGSLFIILLYPAIGSLIVLGVMKLANFLFNIWETGLHNFWLFVKISFPLAVSIIILFHIFKYKLPNLRAEKNYKNVLIPEYNKALILYNQEYDKLLESYKQEYNKALELYEQELKDFEIKCFKEIEEYYQSNQIK